MIHLRGSTIQAGPNAEPSVPNFDGLARFYRWMEYATFGPWLWWCRCYFLPTLKYCRNAVMLGDGDGRFTARLLAINPVLHVDAIDASRSMLRNLVRNAGPLAERISAHCADARNWQPTSQAGDRPFDLVVTHFFLDCLTTEEVRDLAERLRASLAPQALWVVSEFAMPRNCFGQLVARPIIRALYGAFGMLTGLNVRALPDYVSVLEKIGFVLEKRRTWLGGLLVSELWSFDRESPLL